MRRLACSTATIALIATAGLGSTPASAGVQPYLGEIQINGYNFCPRGFAEAAGQILSIQQNTALFSLLGTQYGGNGTTTFALPDLRGRVPMSQGSGPGLTPRSMGEAFGTQTNTLTVANMPAHAHTAHVNTTTAAGPDTRNPISAAFSETTSNTYSDATPPTNAYRMAAGTVTTDNAGGSQPMNNLMPYTTLRYCIALQGIFPSRN